MKAHPRRALIATLLGALSLLLSQAPAFADAIRVATRSDAVAAATTIHAALLAEPLSATGATTVEEDQALADALVAHERRSRSDDVTQLTAFLSRYPQSGWNAALLINLGYSYIHQGYFSKALDAWQEAWRQGKGATAPQAKALVDRAVGELAMLYASLGKMAELASLFDEIGTRPITGSATELIQVARETLTVSEKDPRHLFLCGPLALQTLMLARGSPREQVSFLQWHQAGPNGTSLAEVAGLAAKAKFQFRLVYRQPGQLVPVPSVAHMKVGHFAAIVTETNGRLQVEDPALRDRTPAMTEESLDSEASGYFLIPADLPEGAGWRAVATAEAARI